MNHELVNDCLSRREDLLGRLVLLDLDGYLDAVRDFCDSLARLGGFLDNSPCIDKHLAFALFTLPAALLGEATGRHVAFANQLMEASARIEESISDLAAPGRR